MQWRDLFIENPYFWRFLVKNLGLKMSKICLAIVNASLYTLFFLQSCLSYTFPLIILELCDIQCKFICTFAYMS